MAFIIRLTSSLVTNKITPPSNQLSGVLLSWSLLLVFPDSLQQVVTTLVENIFVSEDGDTRLKVTLFYANPRFKTLSLTKNAAKGPWMDRYVTGGGRERKNALAVVPK